MKVIKVLVLALLPISVLAAGCINPFATLTPTPTPAPTATPAPVPTVTATPTSSLPLSPPYMPNQTTNGRTSFPSPSIASIANGSHPGGNKPGELGSQPYYPPQ